MAVAVRELNNLIAELGQSVQPQKQLIDADIIANDQSGQAQVKGLEATKDQQFGIIEQAAQDKGMLFSGFTPDEQAKYTSTSYLPALANLQATIAQTRSNLLGKKADLDTNVFQQAFQTREGDIGRKFTYDQTQEDRAFQERQAAIQRDFQAKESARDRAAAAANAAASKSSVSPAEVLDADRRAIAGELSKVTGGDGFVSQGSYATMKNQWTSAGYDGKTFDSYFASFRNPKNNQYKLTK